MRIVAKFLVPVLALALCACGDDDVASSTDASTVDAAPPDGAGHHVAPRLIPGGGVGDAPILGELHVHAIDSVTYETIEGAQVRVGEPDASAPLTGTTDADGLVTFTDPSLDGPQVVTVRATGYAVVTWFGAAGANVTVALDPDTPGVPDTATVSGTITGWASPVPANHLIVVFVASSLPGLFRDSPEIAQGSKTVDPFGDMAANTCVKAWFNAPDCSWTLRTRTGKQFLVGVVVDRDTKGTWEDQSDDTVAIGEYAFRFGLDLARDETLTGQDLDPVAAADMADATLAFDSPPAGLGTVAGFALLDVGDSGVMPLFFTPATPTDTTISLPKLAGLPSGVRYDFLASAKTTTDVDDPSSAIFLRQADVAAVVDMGAWMATPTDLDYSSGTWSFTGVTGATMHAVDIEDDTGAKVWSVALVDGRTSFTLPALTPDPLPVGTLTMKAMAFEVPGADLEDFSLERDLFGKLTRQSSNVIETAH